MEYTEYMALSEQLREAMRRWTTGVAVLASQAGDRQMGMTINSFTSVSIDPPIITATLAINTRTHALVSETGLFALTILSKEQEEISDRFAGRIGPEDDRFRGLKTFQLVSGCPFLVGGLAFLDCKVVASHPMGEATLFIADVIAIQVEAGGEPLVYHNRKYHQLTS